MAEETKVMGSLTPQDITSEAGASLQFLISRELDRINWLLGIGTVNRERKHDMAPVFYATMFSFTALEAMLYPFIKGDKDFLDKAQSLRESAVDSIGASGEYYTGLYKLMELYRLLTPKLAEVNMLPLKKKKFDMEQGGFANEPSDA